MVDYFAIEDFGEVGFDQRDGLVWIHCRGHGRGRWGEKGGEGEKRCEVVDF